MEDTLAEWDGARFTVLIEQSFAGGRWEWVRITTASTSFDVAADLFEWLISVAERFGYRHVQIERDRSEVVAQWPDGCPH